MVDRPIQESPRKWSPLRYLGEHPVLEAGIDTAVGAAVILGILWVFLA